MAVRAGGVSIGVRAAAAARVVSLTTAVIIRGRRRSVGRIGRMSRRVRRRRSISGRIRGRISSLQLVRREFNAVSFLGVDCCEA